MLPRELQEEGTHGHAKNRCSSASKGLYSFRDAGKSLNLKNVGELALRCRLHVASGGDQGRKGQKKELEPRNQQTRGSWGGQGYGPLWSKTWQDCRHSRGKTEFSKPQDIYNGSVTSNLALCHGDLHAGSVMVTWQCLVGAIGPIELVRLRHVLVVTTRLFVLKCTFLSRIG